MDAYSSSLLAVLVVSLISLVGILSLSIKDNILNKILPFLISFSGGALLGDTFLHLIPELSEEGFSTNLGLTFLGAIVFFFLMEKFIHVHHSHTSHNEEVHSMVYVTQLGDTLHNFIDGMVIAGSFLVSPALGVASTVAIILHEIPQEIGNFGILIHGGWSKGKAILMNFASALSAFVGALIVLYSTLPLEIMTPYLLAIAGANFLYLALSDIIPEIQGEQRPGVILMHAVMLIIGMGLMAVLLLVE